MAVFGRSGCIRAKVYCIRVKWLYLGKENLFGQKLLYSGKSCFIRAEVVLFGQKWLSLGKVLVFGQKCL